MNKKIILAFVTIACIVSVTGFLLWQNSKNDDITDASQEVEDYLDEGNNESDDSADTSGSPPTDPTDDSTPKSVMIIKNVDANDDDTTIGGATIKITNQLTNEEFEKSIPENGFLQEELPLGTYLIQEVSPAENYTPNENVQQIETSMENSPQVVVFESVKLDGASSEGEFAQADFSDDGAAAPDNGVASSEVGIDSNLFQEQTSEFDQSDPYDDVDDSGEPISQGSINEDDFEPLEEGSSDFSTQEEFDSTALSESSSEKTENPKTSDNSTILRAAIFALVLVNAGLIYIFFLYKKKYS